MAAKADDSSGQNPPGCSAAENRWGVVRAVLPSQAVFCSDIYVTTHGVCFYYTGCTQI